MIIHEFSVKRHTGPLIVIFDVLKLISCMNDEDLGDAYKLAEKRRYERNLIRKVYKNKD